MILHLFSDYTPSDADTKRRMALARSTWDKQPWKEFPVRDADIPVSFKEDGRIFPFLKNLFDLACAGEEPNDIVVFTNSDICVSSDCALRVTCALQPCDACYSFRQDFARLDKPLADEQISTGHAYAGCDLVAFRVRWWRRHREEMADMLVAAEAWDAVMRVLIEESNPGVQMAVPNITYHEKHRGNGHWEKPENRYRLERQKHNLRLAWNWLYEHRKNPAQFGIRKI